MPRGTNGGQIQSIQALRALAAISVVLCHINFIGVGSYGVDIFFVISGFIMCQISATERGRFFLYRIARIVPLYWVATLAVFSIAIIKPALLNSTTADIGNLIRSMLFIPHARANGIVLPVLGLGWTLNYEMFFYAIFAICLLAFPPRLAAIVCAASLSALALVGSVFALPSPWDFWADIQVLEFVAGIGLFYLYNAWRRNLQRVSVAVLATAGIAAFAAMVINAIFVAGHSIAFYMPCAFAIVLAALGLEGRMSVPVAVLAIGDASYSLYLLHPYIVGAVARAIDPMSRLTGRGAVAAAVSLAGSVLLDLLSYRIFERPSNRVLRNLIAAHQLQRGRTASRNA